MLQRAVCSWCLFLWKSGCSDCQLDDLLKRFWICYFFSSWHFWLLFKTMYNITFHITIRLKRDFMHFFDENFAISENTISLKTWVFTTSCKFKSFQRHQVEHQNILDSKKNIFEILVIIRPFVVGKKPQWDQNILEVAFQSLYPYMYTISRDIF